MSRKPLNDTQRELALKYLPMANRLAQHFIVSCPGLRDEYQSVACLALVEAAGTFDSTKNVLFSAFARFRIRGELIDFARTKDIKLPVEPHHVIDHHEDIFNDIDSVEGLLKKLPAKNGQVLRLKYLYGKTFNQIAKKLGCSYGEISRLHKQSLILLDDYYDSNGDVKVRKQIRRKSNACT